MYELRWNPVLKWWVMVSSERQNRPLAPNYCPFCPGSLQVPKEYEVLSYDNDWPILRPDPPEVTPLSSSIYINAKSYGKCEVILYSPRHKGSLGKLSLDQIKKLINLWITKYIELGGKDFIKYVFIFENRGKEVGVTITHPHGQIYGFPFIPKKIEIELSSCKEFFEKENKNLHIEILKEELKTKERIVDENDSFVTFVPYFADYPYQVFIIPKEHRLSIDEFNEKEKEDLGKSLKRIVTTYDNLFKKDFPYMMCFHQKPTDGGNYSYYQFHIEFYPPLRNEKTQKFNASSETGSWTHGNPTSPEEKAEELRKTMEKIYGKG
ncbi:MAG: galactose-1-phosphate uridylyltransferase [candidate division WOR-3 bacterium]